MPVEPLRGLAGVEAGVAVNGRYRADELEYVGDDDLEEELQDVSAVKLESGSFRILPN